MDFPSEGYVFRKMNLGPTNFTPFLRINKDSMNFGNLRACACARVRMCICVCFGINIDSMNLNMCVFQ